jgi:TonB family protein
VTVTPGQMARRLSRYAGLLAGALGAALPAWQAQAQQGPGAAEPGGPVRPNIEMPNLLGAATLAYPEEARELGLEADVPLELEIDKDGKVRSVKVLEAAGHGFDEAAESAARALLFTPAKRQGEPVASRIHFTVSFRLPREESTPAPAPAKPAEPSSAPPATTQPKPAAPAHPEATGAVEITVEGERPARDVTRRTLSSRELKTMPGAMGDGIRALQSLPGMAPTPVGSNQVVVRGTGPGSTIPMIDGLFVRDIYHLWGLSSVVPTEVLDRVDFYPGNYSVRYGRGLGGLIDAALRDPKIDGYHGFAQVDLIDARALVEGPVPGVEGWSFLGAARRSHLDAIAMPLLDLGLTPAYYDFQAVLNNRPTLNSRLRLAVIGSHDGLVYRNRDQAHPLALDVTWGFTYFYSTYETRISDAVSWSHTLAVGRIAETFSLDSNTQAYRVDAPAHAQAARTEVTWRALPRLTAHLGTDIQYASLRAKLQVPEAQASGTQPSEVSPLEPLRHVDTSTIYFRPAAYAELVATPLSDTRIVAGSRVDWSRDTDRIDLSPRISARQNLIRSPRRTTLKGGVGVFFQPPLPEQVIPGYGTPNLRSSRAIQASLGVEQELTSDVEASVEGFTYSLDRLVGRSPGANGTLQFENLGTGHTYGLETLLRVKPRSNLYGWLAYTLSRSERRSRPGEPMVLFGFDSTHVLTALASYRLGRGWEIGSKLQFVSGNPYTPIAGALYSSSTDTYLPVMGNRMSRRYPAYHELDVRIQKRWQLGRSTALTIYLDLINVYGKDRIVGLQCSPDLTQCQYEKHPMPFLPSVGVRGEF